MYQDNTTASPEFRLQSSFDATPGSGRVIISLNPKAGAREGRTLAEQLDAAIKQRGLDCLITSDLEQVQAKAEAWRDSGDLRAVVGAGGDGTIALLTNLLDEGVPLAMLPLGTENLLAKHLNLRADPEALASIIAEGRGVRMDVGEADGRLFLLMLGCGFDADVVRRLHAERSGHIHHFSYAKPIIESICNYQYPSMRVFCDDEAEPIDAKWAFLVNLPRYAGGLQFSPGANEFDGQIDVCTFKQGSLWHGLRYLTGVVLQQHQHWDDFQVRPAATIRIESDHETPYQLDGDPGGMLPVTVRVRRERLSILASREWIEAAEQQLD